MTTGHLAFTDVFAPASEADWRALVQRALGEADFDRKLAGKTVSGQRIEPIYSRPAAASLQPARRAGRWQIVQRADHPDTGIANDQILQDLEGGADAIELVFDSSQNAHSAGLSVGSLNELDRLLDGVKLDLISLRVDAGHNNRLLLAMLIALAERRGIEPEAMRIILHTDAFGHGLNDGRIALSDDQFVERMRDMVISADRHGMRPYLAMIEGKAVHQAGGSEEQELAFAAACLVHHLRLHEAAGIAPERLAPVIGVRMAADADQHLTIAKLRAMRRIWARILDACDLPQHPLLVHAETAWRMMTCNDPHVNMLRTTMAAFAAGIGGADSITILPFSAALGLPDAFTRRIARNTQSILLEESNLHRVTDPAAGSGAIETLTTSLCERGWDGFQRIEAEGGLRASLGKGRLQREIADVLEARRQQIATRRQPITGVSEFATLSETRISVDSATSNGLATSARQLDLPPPCDGDQFEALIAAADSGARLAQMAVSRGNNDPQHIAAAPIVRLSEPYEALRQAAWLHRETTLEIPTVYLAQLGKPADFQARSSFAANAFAAGGIAVMMGEKHDTPHHISDDFRSSGLRIACLCSSDRIYDEIAAEAIEALRTVGASNVFIAGKPPSGEEKLRAAGVTAFIYSGCNLLNMLQEIHAMFGIDAVQEARDEAGLL